MNFLATLLVYSWALHFLIWDFLSTLTSPGSGWESRLQTSLIPASLSLHYLFFRRQAAFVSPSIIPLRSSTWEGPWSSLNHIRAAVVLAAKFKLAKLRRKWLRQFMFQGGSISWTWGRMSQGGKNSSFGGKHWFTFYSIVYELCDPGSITEPLWALTAPQNGISYTHHFTVWGKNKNRLCIVPNKVTGICNFTENLNYGRFVFCEMPSVFVSI